MKQGTDFEDYIHYVYSTILNLKGEKIQVSKRTTFKVPSGETYEIDIFYEFMNVGVRHRVAIECKDWNSPVSQGKVLEFHQKIKNIGEDIVGIFISKSGYQPGAEKVAKRHGILTLSIAEIPTIIDLVRKQIHKFFLPEKDDIGEPFWTIMELNSKNQINGNYCLTPATKDHEAGVPLFLSKIDAEIYLSCLPDKRTWCVRGLRQYHLKAIIEWSKIHNNYFYIALTDNIARKVQYDILEKEYYLL